MSKRRNVLEYLTTYLRSQITIANGYNNTLATCKRGVRFPDELPDSAFPSVFIYSTDETRDNITRNQFKGNIKTTLFCIVKNKSGLDGVQSEIDYLIEDVCKAIEQDRTMNGNIHWTEISRIKVDDGDENSHGVAMIDLNFNYASQGVSQ